MRLAISNIAWDVSEDTEVARLLQRYGVDAIDIAPGKYFPEPKKADDAGIIPVRRWWEDHGIEVTGMQALLFGTTGLNLFGPPRVQKSMLEHIDALCRIGSGLGATRLVFGSPKNRDRSGLTDEQANLVAMEFFLRLADLALGYGVVICLEPNPASYGCNFMTASVETAELVDQIAHPAIRMQLDTGAITINQEDPATIVARSAHLIGHIHASEPDLVPLGDGGTEHGKFAALLTQTLPQHLVSIEMLATKDESHLDSIERALEVAIRHYRNNGNDKGTLE
jgi:D-psicose/D-tagatose/L-ribulose 3-epimerase